MFHVFRVLSPGFSRTFFKYQSLYRGQAWNISKSLRIYRGPYPIQGECFQVPEPIKGREASRFFQVLKPIYRGGGSRSFSKSQSIQQEVFLHIFNIFLHIFHMSVGLGKIRNSCPLQWSVKLFFFLSSLLVRNIKEYVGTWRNMQGLYTLLRICAFYFYTLK